MGITEHFSSTGCLHHAESLDELNELNKLKVRRDVESRVMKWRSRALTVRVANFHPPGEREKYIWYCVPVRALGKSVLTFLTLSSPLSLTAPPLSPPFTCRSYDGRVLDQGECLAAA